MLPNSDRSVLGLHQLPIVLLVFFAMSGSVYGIDIKLGQDTKLTQMNWHASFAEVPAPTNPGTLPPDAIEYSSAGNVAHTLVNASASGSSCEDAQSGNAHALVGVIFTVLGTPGESAQATITFNFSSSATSVLDGGGTADASLYHHGGGEICRAHCTTHGTPATCGQEFGTTEGKLTLPIFLQAGQTYSAALHVYAHADICEGISQAHSDVTIDSVDIDFTCDFSTEPPIERCFGGIGSQCEGNIPFLRFKLDKNKCYATGFMSAGSILHDRCCVLTGNTGVWCANWIPGTSGNMCLDYWDLAFEDVNCGRYWKEQFGPYYTGNQGDDIGKDLRVPAGKPVEPSYAYMCQSGQCEADKQGMPKIKCHDDCCYCICSK